MLCFLPMAPAWREPQLPPRPAPGNGLAGFAIAGIVLLALLTPFGWVHPQPVYAAQVGVAARFAPRAEDAGLVARLERAVAPVVDNRERYAYFIRGQHDDSLPPGLSLDRRSGALSGVPSLAGTYTLTLGVKDGANRSVTGESFKIRVLPAS